MDGISIAAEVGGEGPPVLLLHGYPQHRGMWSPVAQILARRYTVVAADLRGYGESSKPVGDDAHETYAKRTMANDQVALMAALGFTRFAVCGHDRGARVAHRMCLDHPSTVVGAAVIDIVPTLHLFRTTDMAFAQAYYHWFFLSQPRDLPEQLIGAATEPFLRTTLERWSGPGFSFDDDSLRSYVDAFTPDAIHASCEDYRAAASIDLVHDTADLDAQVTCPLLVMWGEHGAMHRLYDVAETWTSRALDLRTALMPTGHFVPEEAPSLTAESLLAFLSELSW